MCALTAYVTVAGSSSSHVWLEACVRVLVVAAPLAVGIYARGRPPFERFGALLILASAGAFVASLSESENAALYSSGRVAGWIVDLGITYLVLSFPSGRLVTRRDRVIVGSIAAVVGFLFLPTALLADQFPMPSQWTSCDAACPANAFMVVGVEPAFVEDVLRPVRGAARRRPVRRRHRGRRAPHARNHAPDAADARAGHVRRSLPARHVRRDARRAARGAGLGRGRGRALAARAHASPDGARVPDRPRPLAPVHRRGDAAARRPAAGASGARGPPGGARRRLRRSLARDRLPGRRRQLGRRLRRAGDGPGRGRRRSLPDRPCSTASAASPGSSTTRRSATTVRSSTSRRRTRS